MDPILCCLLGVCCPPLARREKMIAHFASLGLDAAGAERVADDVIARVDALMGTALGAMFKHIVTYGHKE